MMSCLSYELKNPITMKTIKILLLLVAFSTATFYSCSDENAIKSETTAQKSTALRTVLNKLKLENTVGPNRSAVVSANPATPMLCFEFVFPITFSYNNGTVISASSLDGLLDILDNESPSLYLSGVVFPFQVQTGGAVQTITNEADLIALIIQCGLPTFNDDLQYSYCFDIVFPIQAGSAGQVVTINSQVELNDYLNNPSNGTEANIIFPITIITGNETTVLNNVYDFYAAVNDCNAGQCICTQEYAPVCVQTPNGVIEFSNMCYALCEYTQNDIVSCAECSISNIQVTTGTCNPNGTYELTLDFDSTNSPGTEFSVYASGSIFVGTYTIASLPVTISNFPVSLTAIPNDTMVIRITEACFANASWLKPNCNDTCVCPTVVLPVCVQTPTGVIQFQNECIAMCEGFTQSDFVTCPIRPFAQVLENCFDIIYPVTVQWNGALIIANSDSELLQHWNPTVSPVMPVMNYPITAIFENEVLTFANQAAFESQINISCP